jgi:DNA invertase Pin-like site-specific DNA recombinase
MTVRAAIYARTSPDCPLSADEQIAHLATVANERGWTIVQAFIDRQATVKKDRRPAEMALVGAIRSGGVDKVLIFGIDRVGRTLVDLIVFMEVCRTAGVSLWLDEQRLDTAGSNGLPLFDVMEMLAYHLRQTRRDRILRGQAAARSLSIRFGRPPIARAKMEKARIALAAGKGVRQAARIAGISAASASRLKSALGTTFVTA